MAEGREKVKPEALFVAGRLIICFQHLLGVGPELLKVSFSWRLLNGLIWAPGHRRHWSMALALLMLRDGLWWRFEAVYPFSCFVQLLQSMRHVESECRVSLLVRSLGELNARAFFIKHYARGAGIGSLMNCGAICAG